MPSTTARSLPPPVMVTIAGLYPRAHLPTQQTVYLPESRQFRLRRTLYHRLVFSLRRGTFCSGISRRGLGRRHRSNLTVNVNVSLSSDSPGAAFLAYNQLAGLDLVVENHFQLGQLVFVRRIAVGAENERIISRFLSSYVVICVLDWFSIFCRFCQSPALSGHRPGAVPSTFSRLVIFASVFTYSLAPLTFVTGASFS